MSTNDETQNTMTETMNTETVPLIRRSTMGGGGDVDLPALPTSPLVRHGGAPPTETVSDSELDICGGIGLRALLSARIATWAADASGGVHPFIRPLRLRESRRRFHGLTALPVALEGSDPALRAGEREGFADFVENAYLAAKEADVMLELAMVPLLEGKSEAMIDCAIGDIAGRIRERMAMFNPVAVGPNLYYGALVYLVAAAKEDARTMPLAQSDVHDADHEVTGVAAEEENEEDEDDHDDAGAEADTEEENEDDEVDENAGAEDRIQHVEPSPTFLQNEVSISLPLWVWLAALVVFAAWAALVTGVLSRKLGYRP